MRFHSNVAIVMRLSGGVMVRTRSIQRQERDGTIKMLNKLVGVPWDPTGVVRARADGGHHDGEHSHVGSDVKRSWITSDPRTDTKKYVDHK